MRDITKWFHISRNHLQSATAISLINLLLLPLVLQIQTLDQPDGGIGTAEATSIDDLAQSSSAITRSFSYPTLKFQGEDAAILTVSISWHSNGTTVISDNRGYSYSITMGSQADKVSLLQNSSTVVQRVEGEAMQYEVYWTPEESKDGIVRSYKFTIIGNTVNGTSPNISFDLGGTKYAESKENSLIVNQPASASKLQEAANDVSGSPRDWTTASLPVLSRSEILSAFEESKSSVDKDPQDLESDGLTLNWTDAVESGHAVSFDLENSKIQIQPKLDSSGKFVIDPTVVGTITSSISPGMGNSFEGEVRLLSTAERINAFYYDGSNIVYKTSDDKGKTWSTSATSTGSGTLAADSYRWSIVRTAVNDTMYASLLYWRAAGNNMNFYSMRGFINGSVLQSWSSPTLLGTTTENSVYCFNGSACPAVATTIDDGGNIYAAFTWISGGATEYTYKILKSSNGGLTWSTSLPDVHPAGTTRPTMALAPLNASKVLFIYTRDDASSLFYRVYNGSAWSSQQTLSTNTALAAGTIKHISATSDDQFNAFVAFTNATTGTGGILKLAIFSSDGSFQSVETADSTRRHRLPNAMYSFNGGLNIYTISGSYIYTTRLLSGIWEPPVKAFTTSSVSPNQLTAVNLFGDDNSALWREGTASPYDIVFGLLREGTVVQTEAQVSPGTSEYFEGEHRIVATANGTLFAFYHEGSDIRYKPSLDGGHTWIGNGTYIGSGNINSDDFRWTAIYRMNPTERISVLYYVQDGTNTIFKHKTFEPSGRTLVQTASSNLFSAANDASCSPAGVCASAVGASDSNSTVLFAAFKWKSGGTWNYRIMKSSDGGSTWSTSLSSTSVTTSQRFPIALTYLGSNKMLFSYSTYESSNISYRVYNGSSWGSVQTVSGTGLSSNSVKQLSADSNATGHVYLAYPASGISGTLKAVRFSNSTGSSLGVDTVDSTRSYSLPSVVSTGTNSVFVYSLSGGKIYASQFLDGAWLSPENYLLQDITADQLTTAFKFPMVMVREGSSAPHSLMTALDYTAVESYGPLPNINATGGSGQMSMSSLSAAATEQPYVAVYDYQAKQAVKKLRFTCNFDGMDPLKIQSDNHLTCTGASTVFTYDVPGEDWGYVATVTLKRDGYIRVGAEIWRSCEPAQSCRDLDPGEITRKWIKPYPLNIGHVSAITYVNIIMRFDQTTTKVTWEYAASGDAISGYKTYASYTHNDSHVHSVFQTGKLYSIPCLCNVKYFQVGITSKYNIGQSGWKVWIYDMAYSVTSTGGNTYLTDARSVQGDDSFWDWWARWGGAWYYKAKATQYDCAGNYPIRQVLLSYTSSVSVGNGVKFWVCS